MSLYYYIMQYANTFKYIFTNLFVRVYELNDTSWSLFYAYRFVLGNIAGQLYPRFSFISKMCPFCWSTVSRQCIQQFVQVSRPYEYCLDTDLRVSEYKIQYNVFCFPTEWESWIQDSRIFSTCLCGRLWQKTTHFLEMLTAFENN